MPPSGSFCILGVVKVLGLVFETPAATAHGDPPRHEAVTSRNA